VSHIVFDVRSHLGGANAGGKSAKRIGGTSCAEQQPVVSQYFLDLHSSKSRMLLSWDFGMAGTSSYCVTSF
jgi:hypothetical protein